MTHENRKPNRLIHEPSPYLQQHAHNPVDWYAWGDEALEKAKRENKPIFLSVGYSACHWCHVMERESFESDQVAEALNDHFVAIKVDREERPDLDHIYQSICQMVTRAGGWPLSVWLTPDLKPFHVGTYFPPEDRYGRPGFRKITLTLAGAWANNRAKVEEVAAQWTEYVRRGDDLPPPAETTPEREVLTKAAVDLIDQVDPEWGGIGKAPKFPHADVTQLLLRAYKANGQREFLEAALLTLRRMAGGGIYDQLGGGFSRYSVDQFWAVPHFEKMLYDNAQIPLAYLDAYQITGDPSLAATVRETLAYVAREMTHPDGGFYSTQDADSEGVEGKFFAWTPEQIKAVLGDDLGQLLCEHLGVTAQGNFEHGSTVLHINDTAQELAAKRDQPVHEIAAAIAEGKRRLFEVREQRVKPFRDEKILTGWNGLMITCYARAAQVLNEPAYAQAAARAADFILTHVTRPGGDLLRRFKDGQAAIDGYLEDYAYFTAGLIDLYEATFDRRWLELAERYAAETVTRFWDEADSGFFLTPAGAAHLIHRPKDITDQAVPAGNSIATRNLLRLHPHTGEDRWRDLAEQVFKAYHQHLSKMSWGVTSLLAALDFYLGATEITIVAPAGDPLADEWAKRIGQRYIPHRILTRATPEETTALDAPPLLRGKALHQGQATVYVCRNFACSPPATTWAEIEALLQG